MKKLFFLSIAVIVSIAAVSAFGATADAFPDLTIAKPPTVTSYAIVKAKLANLLKTDNHVATANDYLKKTLGFTPAETKDNYWGMEIAAQNMKSKKTLVCTILMQDYTKKGSKDLGMLCQVNVTTPDKKKETYTFLITAADGKVENFKEFYVDEIRFTKVIPNSKGWLNSIWENVNTKCKPCVGSLGTCVLSSFSAYIGCLNTSCGECFQKVLVCASCGCGSNCIAICGCCER
jgi:hypothetical protein